MLFPVLGSALTLKVSVSSASTSRISWSPLSALVVLVSPAGAGPSALQARIPSRRPSACVMRR